MNDSVKPTNLKALLHGLQHVEPNGPGYKACCPCHNDSSPSLSIREYDTGFISVMCFAGCSGRTLANHFKISSAKIRDDGFSYHPGGREISDGFFDGRKQTISLHDIAEYTKLSPAELFHFGVENITANYDEDYILGIQITYRNTKGKQDRARCRYSLTEKPKWDNSKNKKMIPYGLWYLDRSTYGDDYYTGYGTPKPDYVILVEGESDCWCLWHSRFRAVGVPGSNFTKILEAEVLDGCATVYIWQEPDKAGQKFVEKAYQRLRELSFTGEIKIIRKDNVKDARALWTANPKTGEFIKSMLDILANGVSAEKFFVAPSVDITELSIADAVISRVAERIKYCDELRGWLSWDGKRFVQGDEATAYNHVVEYVRLLKTEAEKLLNPVAKEKRLIEIKRFEANGKVHGVLEMLRRRTEILTHQDQWDADAWQLNVMNGVLDLRTGELMPHDVSRFITKISPVQFDPSATCPLWESCLRTWFKNKPDLIPYMQRLIGVCLTGTTLKLLPFLYGLGHNGKSTLISLLSFILGDYATTIQIESLLTKQQGGIPNDLAALKSVRFVSTNETPENKRLNEPLVKMLTGKDMVTARFLFHEFFQFKPQFKLWISGNHKPGITGTDEGIWGRMKLIHFDHQISKDDQILDLEEKLQSEGAGIINWALAGLLSWLKDDMRLDDPPCLIEATNEYRKECDYLGAFIEDFVEFVPGQVTAKGELAARYARWAHDAGIAYPLNSLTLGKKLTEKGWKETSGRSNGKKEKQWLDVKLRDDFEDDVEDALKS